MELRRLLNRESAGALVLALALPLLFFGEEHGPEYRFDVGTAELHLGLADVAVVAVLVAAVAAALRFGAWRLNAARIVWIPGLLLLGWLAFEALRPESLEDPASDGRVIGYLELLELSLLAVAVPLVVRRALDLSIVVASVVLWSVAATAVGLAQFFGLDVLDAGEAGGRQPSFLAPQDLAALSALSLGLAAAGILATRRRIPVPVLFPVALLAGGLGLVLAGSVGAVAGFGLGAILALVAARGRLAPAGPRTPGLLAFASLVVIVAVGVLAVRAGWTEALVERAGIAEESDEAEAPSPEREVLAYIALRAFQDNPVLGVGWLRSGDVDVVGEYVGDATERYPDAPAETLPSAEQELIVPSLYVQLLAETGFLGLALLLVVGVGGLVLAWRTAEYASSPWAAGAGLATLCTLPALAGTWALVELVPGNPLQSATALTLGIAAAGAATVEEESGG